MKVSVDFALQDREPVPNLVKYVTNVCFMAVVG